MGVVEMTVARETRRVGRSSERKRARRVVRVGIVNLVVYAGAFVCLFPFLWMLSTALKPENNALTNQFFIGYTLHWTNFLAAWNFFPFGRFMINSVIMSVGGVLVVVVASTTSGYAFARLQFRFREQLFLVYVVTLLVPASVTIIPLFLISKDIHIYNSYLALVFPISFSAFGTFLMRQFFRTLPEELSDSARLDGASEWRIFGQILLPLARAGVAVLAVFTFIADWGNFLWPLVVTESTRLETLNLGLSAFQGEFGTYWSYMMAGSALAIAPTVVLVILLQRYLVKGLAFSSFGGR